MDIVFFRLISNVIILLEFSVIYEDFLLRDMNGNNNDINCEILFLDITFQQQQIFRISLDGYRL